MSTTAAAGSSNTLMSTSRNHSSCRFERGTIGRIAQQRLPDALAEDAGLAARGAHHGPRALPAVALAAQRAQAAGRAVERHRLAGRQLERHAGEARRVVLDR